MSKYIRIHIEKDLNIAPLS